MASRSFDITVADGATSGFALLLYWTRTNVTGASATGAAADGRPMELSAAHHEGIVRIRGEVPAGSRVTVTIEYDGEPPVILDIGPLPTVETAHWGDDWRSQHYVRWLHFRTGAIDALRFFLMLDLGTNRGLRRYRKDVRHEPPIIDVAPDRIEALSSWLGDRIRDRWREPPVQGRDPHCKDALMGLRDVSIGLHRQIVAFWPDPTDALPWFDRFATGALRQEFSPPRWLGERYPMIICDADSANVFFFAELAFTSELIRKHPEHASLPDWTPFLNCFVRMQKLYLARWETKGNKFTDYVAAPVALSETKRIEIVEPFEKEPGSDITKLEACMHVHLRELAPEGID